jgi:hypothetical protein
MSDMGRREFMALLSGAAVAWPLAAQAQQPGMPVTSGERSKPTPKSIGSHIRKHHHMMVCKSPMSDMRRREFITLLGGAAAAWPLAARAQQTERMRRIGVLLLGNAEAESLRTELQEGFEGQNIHFDWTEVGVPSCPAR